jgi:hypothetical protein
MGYYCGCGTKFFVVHLRGAERVAGVKLWKKNGENTGADCMVA